MNAVEYTVYMTVQRLRETVEWISHAPMDELTDPQTLLQWIRHVGLVYENRTSPEDPSSSIYGDDVTYMVADPGHTTGIWQTPSQLVPFLLALREKKIKTYLDIGTFTGWTTTIIAAYLTRFGLEHVDAVDIYQLCTPDTQDLWKEYDLPITYIVRAPSTIQDAIRDHYDFVFVDGNHEYDGVKHDFLAYRHTTNMMAFHDINDHFCTGVVALWKELRETYSGVYAFTEFIDHPNGFRLMGIGLMERTEN